MTIRFAILALLVGTAFGAPSLQNGSKLRRAKMGKAIANSYIVILKEGASRDGSLQALNELVVPFDVVKDVTVSDWTIINGHAASLTGSALQHVLNDPAVEYVEENARISLDWKHDVVEISEPKEPQPLDTEPPQLLRRQTGLGVDVYSIDTGVRITHTSFSGRARWGAVFVGSPQDDNGHGTFTAGVVADLNFGTAPAASIIAVKVLDNTGSGDLSGIITGIDWVTNNAKGSGRPSIANFPLTVGGNGLSVLDIAVTNSLASGIHYVLPAGNTNTDISATTPARVAGTITVGALSGSVKAAYSSYGSVLACWYQGHDILSAWSTSDTAKVVLSGTFASSSAIAGLIASHVSESGNSTPQAIRDELIAAALSNATSGIPQGTTTRRCTSF